MKRISLFLTVMAVLLSATLCYGLGEYEINFKTGNHVNNYEHGLIYKGVEERSIQDNTLRLTLQEGEDKAKIVLITGKKFKPDFYERLEISMRIKANEPQAALDNGMTIEVSPGGKTYTMTIPLKDVMGKAFHEYRVNLREEPKWQGTGRGKLSLLLSLGQKEVNGTVIEIRSIKLIPPQWKVVEDKLEEAKRRLRYVDSCKDGFNKQGIVIKGIADDIARLKAAVEAARKEHNKKEVDKTYAKIQAAEELFRKLYGHLDAGQNLTLVAERIKGIKSVIALYNRAGGCPYNAAGIEKRYARLLAGLERGRFKIEDAVQKLNDEIDRMYTSIDKSSPYKLPVRLGLSNTSFGRFGWGSEDYGEGLLINDLANFRMITKGYKQEIKIRLNSDNYRKVVAPMISDKKKDVTWVSYRREILVKGDEGKKYHWDYICSLLAPGIILKTDVLSLSITEKRRLTRPATHMIIPSQDGCQVLELKEGARFVPEMSENWFLLLWEGSKRYSPILMVLEKKPDGFILEGKYLKIENDRGIGHVGIVDYAGVMPFHVDEGKSWIEKVPDEVLTKCQRLSQVMTEYPLESKEFYAIDEVKKEVLIRNEIGYYSLKDEWHSKQVQYAPLPPLLSYVQDKGYPVRIQNKTIDFDIATKYGPYRAAKGGVVSYRIPLPDFNHACYLKTDRDLGITSMNTLAKMLAAKGKETNVLMANSMAYRGPDTGFEDAPFFMVPLAWNLYDKEVHRIFAEQGRLNLNWMDRAYQARRTFDNTDEIWRRHVYADLVEPYTGKYYALTMAGEGKDLETGRNFVYCDTTNGNAVIIQPFYYYAKYTGDWDYIRQMWEYLKTIYLIAARQNDWALSVVFANPHSANTIHDGCLDGIKLPICFMRMAQAIGDRESYLEAAYIASKDAVPVLANHAIGEYMAQYDETVLKAGKEAYCLDLGIGEYGCAIRDFGNFSWKDFMDAWYEVPGAWKGHAGLRFNMWNGVLLSPETFDLQSQFMTEYTKKSVYQSIPQHLPDWYYPDKKWISATFKYLMIRHVLGETTDDFVRYFKSIRYWGAHFTKGLPVYAVLQGRDAPCYLVAWEPNRLIQGTYSFKTNKASFDIQATQLGKVQLKSFMVPQRITDNKKILSKDMWEYDDSRKLLDITIRERGSHKFILDYPEWRIPKRERPFPEYTVLPLERKMSKVSSIRYPGSLGKGLTLYLDFEESLEANASKGSGLPLKPLKDPDYVSGIKGKGLKLGIVKRKRPLAYDANGNLSFKKGTLSFWLKPEHEPELIEKIREELAEEYESRGKNPSNHYFSCRILWTNITRLSNMNVAMFRGRTHFGFRFFSCRKGAEMKHVTMQIPITEMGLNAKEPTHIAATWDGDGKRMTEFCVYADGKLVARRDCREEETVYEVQKFLDYSDTDINIGGWSSNFGPAHIFNRVKHHMKKIGYIYDELRIYDRALSAEEVKALRDFDRR